MASLQKKEKILLGVAGLIAIYFVFNQFVCGEEVPKPSKLAKGTVAKGTVAIETVAKETVAKKPFSKSSGTKKAIQKIANGKFIGYKSWGRDPFAGAIRLAVLDATNNDSSNFVFKGVIWKGNEARVLIGDEILREGERVGDLQILKIEKNRVVCRKGIRTVTLVLDEDDIIP